MHPTERFRQLVERPEDEIPLDEAAFAIAAHARPDLDIELALTRLDELADGVSDLDGVLDRLFVQEGFCGNVVDYYDPDNSFLDQVVSRRLGIPITLSVVTMEVARRAGVALDGVGMPGHFLVRTRELPPRFVDAFGGGRRLDLEGCEALFRATQGRDVPLPPDAMDRAGPRSILARMLGNLQLIYQQRGDRHALVWVLRLRCAIPGASLTDRRAYAMALGTVGQFGAAANELDAIADTAGARADAAIRRQADQLRARLN